MDGSVVLALSIGLDWYEVPVQYQPPEQLPVGSARPSAVKWKNDTIFIKIKRQLVFLDFFLKCYKQLCQNAGKLVPTDTNKQTLKKLAIC